MAVQINEMIIRANIRENSNENHTDAKKPDSNNENKDDIIKECAALVMEMINSKMQR